MTTPAYRLLGDGRRRRLGDGRVRSVGAPIPRYADVGGTTGVGVGASGHPTVWVPLEGESILAFAVAGVLDSAGVLGHVRLRVGVAGRLSGPVNLVGVAPLGFATFARLTAATSLVGATAVSVEVVGRLAGAVALAGMTTAHVSVQGQLNSASVMRGTTGLGLAVSGDLTTSSATRFRDLWREVYDKRQALLNAIDANNRYLAQQAGNTAQAAADAVVLTQTRVTELEDGLQAEAQRITALTTRVTNTETTNTAQGTAINALQVTSTQHGNTLTAHGQQLSNITVQITGLNGQVTNLASATEVLEAEVSSLGQAKAQWGVYLNVNGYISGLQSINNGIVSEFNVLATVFRLLSPGAQNGMEVQDGYVRVWRGSTQVIIGNGFGTGGDLMLYAGPNVGVGNASKSNATIWFDAGGNAYFGGTLSAGIWKNSAQSTQLGVGANVTTGPFDSLGGQRTVVYSFSLVHSGQRVGNNAGVSQVGVTMTLRRGGVAIASQVITGSYVGTYDAELNRTRYICDFGASFTYTDNTGGTSIEYSLELSNPVGTWPRTDFIAGSGSGPTQRLAVISTEEP